IQQGPIPPAEAARIVERSARAVHFAHQHGVVHRDLKPENIVLRTDGEPLVMDFGLAREVGSSAQISVSGQLLGTPSYMAPEQARGDIHLTDARTDVYALGAVLYELLTGRSPHPGDSAMERIFSVLQGEVVSPRSVRADIARDVETICMHCMERDPAARYPSAEALADDLARFQRGESIHVRPPGLLVLAARRVWRRRWLAAGLIAVLAISTIAGASLLRAREAAELEEWARPRVETALEDIERWDQHPYKRDVVLPAVRGEVEAVVRRLDEVLARHPACAPAWYARGKAFRRLRRLREADVDLSHAIDLAPENAQYRLERARVTFEVILEVNLSDELASGLADQLGGDWSERIRRAKADLEVARDAGRLRPWEEEACRAMVPLAGGDWQAAIPVLDRAIQAAPNEPDLYFLRGLANLGATRSEATRRANLPCFRRSYEDARKALDIKQSFYEAALVAGWGLFAVSQEEEKLETSERRRLLEEGFVLMRRGTAIDPERQIGFYLLGHAWFWSWRNGKTPHGEAESLGNAAAAWEECARLAPWNEYAATWALQARARLATARPDEEAIPQLRDLVARFAKWSWKKDWAYRSHLEAWACRELAQRLARRGEDASATWARAQEQAESAVRHNVNEGLYPELIEGLARIAAERGTTPAEASARACQGHAGRALTARPDDPRSLAFRGMALLWLGDKAAARAELERAASLDAALGPLVAPWLARAR
ncbi:MAG: serine/threonine-protein kinase, partial [Planctomycetota bacterium]